MTEALRRWTAMTAALGLCTALVTGCGSTAVEDKPTVAPSTAAGLDVKGCITSFDEGTDYFTDKATFTYAKNITVEYHKSYKVVTLSQPAKGAEPVSFVLVQCGAPKPTLEGDLGKALQIEVPVSKVASASTTQLSPIELIGKAETIVGVSSANYVSNPWYRKRVADGTIKAFGNDQGGIDVEKLVALQPELIIASGMENDSWKKLREMGQPLVQDGAWLENHPLARTEWMKYLSMFFNAEGTAEKEFAGIVKAYGEVSATVKKAEKKPTVMGGAVYKGDWMVPGGESYVAQFIADAGGEYVFAEVKGTGSVTVEAEKVYKTAADTDIWINGNSMGMKKWMSTADLLAVDSRFGELGPVKKNGVWNPTKKIGEGGGNMYWEEGVIHPDWILKDLASVFHPELFDGHETVYYEQVPEKK